MMKLASIALFIVLVISFLTGNNTMTTLLFVATILHYDLMEIYERLGEKR